MLLPALYQLARRGRLAGSHILGVARSADVNDDAFRKLAREIITTKAAVDAEAAREWCEQRLHYRSIGEGGEKEFRSLGSQIEALEKDHSLPGNRLFYLALRPQAFRPTIEGLGRSGLNQGAGWTRIVIEKPFGLDLKSAQELDELAHRYFNERQIYRIDHFLGKETVQNLQVFRFANPIFESLWNRDRIDNVQITVAEDIGIEKRAEYYDQTGALRDMVQNHLTQLLSLIAMEVPAALDAESVRDEKVKVLRSVAPIKRENVVFGQYMSGRINDHPVAGYREEPGALKDSKAETLVALKLEIANWRWNGVPFYLRTGKRMARRTSQITIIFKCAPVSIFRPFGPACAVRSNVLVVTIQPQEGFRLQFEVKQPGQAMAITDQHLGFQYSDAFSTLPGGYEALLQDVLMGEQALFVRSDWVETSWRLYDSLLKDAPEVLPYQAGTWGPAEADKLLARDGNEWFIL
jgi:glucose-6-phosphate 1-dehydrogenase